MLSSHLSNYNNTWDKIDKMLGEIFSKEFNKKYRDSWGKNWVFNWHCVDHVGYKFNPEKSGPQGLKIIQNFLKL